LEHRVGGFDPPLEVPRRQRSIERLREAITGDRQRDTSTAPARSPKFGGMMANAGSKYATG